MEDPAIKLLHLELLLGDGVNVAGDSAAVHNDLQVAEPGSLPVNWKKALQKFREHQIPVTSA